MEELQIFDIATAENPTDAKAFYYFGNLLYFLEHKANAITAWEESAQLDPKFGLTARNLGFAYDREGNSAQAITWYEHSIRMDATNPRTFTEIDQVYQKIGKPAKERLALLQKNLKTVMRHDDAVMRLLGLYHETGDYDKSIKILDTRHFHVWEGSGQIHEIFVDAHLLKGISLTNRRRYDEAIKHFALADSYPDNLEVGRPDNGGQFAKIYYYMGKAYAAKGDKDKARECFVKAVVEPRGRSRGISEREMFRAMALQELGEKAKANDLIAACKTYIETQLSSRSLIDEFSKFGEDGTPSQRLSQIFYLNGLASYAQGDKTKANEEFAKAIRANRNMIWPKLFQ